MRSVTFRYGQGLNHGESGGTCCQEPNQGETGSLVLGAWFLVRPSSVVRPWSQSPRAAIAGPGTTDQGRTRDQGRTKYKAPSTKDRRALSTVGLSDDFTSRRLELRPVGLLLERGADDARLAAAIFDRGHDRQILHAEVLMRHEVLGNRGVLAVGVAARE